MTKEKIYWLDGFNGKAKGGAYYRSGAAIDIKDFEDKFGVKVVAIGLEETNGKASYNVNMITEVPLKEV